MTSQKTIAKQKVSGVILIDKPQGMTSQQVVSKVKYLFQSPEHNSKKAGHTGTLDPMATGLLPICLGEATKFSHYQLDADKSYQATILLGSQTDTGDADGQTVAQAEIPELNAESLNSLAQQFMGAQQQIPPMYSALKKDGKKLYEYARAGIEIDRPARDIVIKSLTLTQINLRTFLRILVGSFSISDDHVVSVLTNSWVSFIRAFTSLFSCSNSGLSISSCKNCTVGSSSRF